MELATGPIDEEESISKKTPSSGCSSELHCGMHLPTCLSEVSELWGVDRVTLRTHVVETLREGAHLTLADV